MNVKTFEAESMSAALTLVKRDLGGGAVILQTRSLRRGGLLGIGARSYVQLTASNEVDIVPPKLRHRPEALPRAEAGEPHAPTVHVSANLDAELKQIRRMVERMADRQSSPVASRWPGELGAAHAMLVEREVARELADEVIGCVREKLEPGHERDERRVREAVLGEIAGRLPVDAAVFTKPRPADGRPLTIALIGPTGVGKTTTLAKLAATFKLRYRKKAALITLDTYRIAAVDQLRTYADIIQVPLHVAQTPAEVRSLLHRCGGHDAVLIDTAGRGQRDQVRLDQLGALLDAIEPHETHLTLSAAAGPSVLAQAAERFGRLRADRVLFTKLDEAVKLGSLLSAVRKVGKPVSYLTFGQEVPNQIEPAEPRKLAEMILG